MTDLSEKYKKLSELEAVLLNPEMYINSIQMTPSLEWVLEDEKIVKKDIQYIPALRQLFEEALVNCRDHSIRSRTTEEKVSFIHVAINKESGELTFSNDGRGIDVEIHPTEKIYIPELVFGHLRTSTNYRKDSLTGGAWGLGIKLVNIWSARLSVKIQDKERGLTYTQTFRDNMKSMDKPTIRKSPGLKSSLTQISFVPDYKRFGVDGLDDDLLGLFERRVMDLAAITDGVQLKYNGRVLKKKEFKDYIGFFTSVTPANKAIFTSENWKVAVFCAESFTHLSFVNGICAKDGGTHVDFVMSRIVSGVRTLLEKEKKIKVGPQHIRDQLFLVLSCNVAGARFNSQIKSKLTSQPSGFFPLALDPEFLNRVYKLVRDKAAAMSSLLSNQKEDKEVKRMARETDGVKTSTILGIPTLVDANFAGTRKSQDCILIICEGNSASTGICSGLSSEQRNTIGVYPIRGKLANLRNVSSKTILENRVVGDIKRILGLKTDVTYTSSDIKKLRYGKVVFMTDQDLDGQHIKALALNMFHVLWPSLLKISHFIGFIQTPIIKVARARAKVAFYRQDEYEKWAQDNPRGWTVKYYKGLGTSVSSEFKEYMSNLKIVYFRYSDRVCDNSFEKVFEKKNADLRKLWLYDYDEKAKMPGGEEVSYSEFIDGELIHFSKYDCDRSIPAFDGLKISQRKILFAAFKKHSKGEIKVAQFAGYVAEQTAYHHGEESLCKAIVGMAQDFVGSNNINLLEPGGQFGSRVLGGDDAASPRYIFTQLSSLTPYIFRAEDNPVLEYSLDDGKQVEPKYYVPVIPFILVNGALGIGTGFSSEFLPRRPTEIVDYLLGYLEDEEDEIPLPWYRNFKGRIEKVGEKKYRVYGCYALDGDELTITELPIGVWSQPYKEYLEKLLEAGEFTDFSALSTDNDIKIVVSGVHEKLLSCAESLEKVFKLSVPISETNMHIFNAENRLVKYSSIRDLIEDHAEVRLDLYEKRRLYLIAELEKKLQLLRNRIKYLEGFINETIKIKGKRADIEAALEAAGLELINGSFEYLLDMKFSSLGEEELDVLRAKYKKRALEKEDLMKTNGVKMWTRELQELREKLCD